MCSWAGLHHARSPIIAAPHAWPPRVHVFIYNRAMNITRLAAILLAGAAAGGSLVLGQSGPVASEWQTYSGDAQGRRDSPLTQINATNVSTLKLAWQYGVPAPGTTARPAPSQAVQILMRGVLYTSTTQRTIVALDPVTGREIWKYSLDKG